MRVQNVKARLLFRNAGHDHKAFADGMVKRIRSEDTFITTQSVDFKAGHSGSAKSNQAWRYAGGNIVRAESAMINGSHYYDPKSEDKLPRRKQESNFFITINSNKKIDPLDKNIAAGSYDMAAQAMQAMLKKLSEEEVLATYIKFGPKDQHYITDKFADVIHSIDWNSAVERGDVEHRVHAHVWLTITHYSQIQINVQALMHLARKHYNAAVGANFFLKPGKNLQMDAMPFVHVKLLPQSDWTSVMRQYIHKGMIAASSSNAPGISVDADEL